MAAIPIPDPASKEFSAAFEGGDAPVQDSATSDSVPIGIVSSSEAREPRVESVDKFTKA